MQFTKVVFYRTTEKITMKIYPTNKTFDMFWPSSHQEDADHISNNVVLEHANVFE